jgi:hypothetical protein
METNEDLKVIDNVAEPELEPVEQQLFAGPGAGAKIFLARLRSRVCIFL